MQILETKKPIELLSKHLFWNTPVINVEVEKSKNLYRSKSIGI